MARKLITAQRPFTMLVANLSRSSDPSKGAAGNPVKMRETFTQQNFVEVPGRGPDVVGRGRIPGTGTRQGHLDWAVTGVPVGCTGTITVASAVFTGPTTVQLGDIVLTSGEDFAVGAAVQSTGVATVVANPSTATLTIGAQGLTDAGGARTPGLNDYDGTLANPGLIAADMVAAINDGANAFGAIATAVDAGGGVINLTAVPIGAAGDAVALVTSDVLDVTVSGAFMAGGIDATDTTAVLLAAAIDALEDYAAPVPGANVITVTGPVGPIGNDLVFQAGGSSPASFTLVPVDGQFSGAEPFIGPPIIT